MLAYGHGNVKVKVFCNNKWEEANLINVWYVPDSNINIFSVIAAAKNGFVVTFDKSAIKIIRIDNQQVAATGYLGDKLYILNIQAVSSTQSEKVNLAKENSSLQLYHERLAHQNKAHIKQILKRMNIEITDDTESLCDGCALGKMHRLPFKTRPYQSMETGELIHADVNEPMQTNFLGGARYFVCFKDDYSKFRKIVFVKNKSEVFKKLEIFLNEARANGHIVKRFRSDGGGEFVNKKVDNLLSQRGIEHIITPPYTPQLNGTAERENRTIVEAARSMLSSSKLPKFLWAEACNTAVDVLNLTGKSRVENKFPYELWYKRKVQNITHLKVFGTGCYVHVPKHFREKFDNKAVYGHMVGYVNNKDGFRVWLPSKNKIICSHDILFKSETICNTKRTADIIIDENISVEEANSNILNEKISVEEANPSLVKQKGKVNLNENSKNSEEP